MSVSQLLRLLNTFHYYLYPKQFLIYSDHQPLKWLYSVKNARSRLFKWRLKLNQYSYQINYIPGSKNIIADCLSRSPVTEFSERDEHLRVVNLIDKRTIKNSQKRFTADMPKKTIIENDLIVKIKDNLHKIFIPDDLIGQLLNEFHKEFGHIGAKKMLALISSNYYFKNISEKINQFLLKCEICQTNKINRRKKLGQLSQIGPAQNPYDIISIDTIGGFSGYNSKKTICTCCN